jgi:hypothetical protein
MSNEALLNSTIVCPITELEVEARSPASRTFFKKQITRNDILAK